MLINRNDANGRHAVGFIVPFIRVATHIGYCCAIASNTEKPWDERKRDIQSDLSEAMRHMGDALNANSYISPRTIALMEDMRRDIETLQTANIEEAGTLADLQIAAHNLAYTIAQVERDTVGNQAVAGTEL